MQLSAGKGKNLAFDIDKSSNITLLEVCTDQMSTVKQWLMGIGCILLKAVS